MISILRDIQNKKIICGDLLLKAGVLIPFYKEGKNLKIILEKRAKEIRQGSEISFPGGLYQKGKDQNLLETAIRETEEEIGIPKNRIKILGPLGILSSAHGVYIEPYMGLLEMKNLCECSIQKEEVEKLINPPLDFFLENKPEKYKIHLSFQSYQHIKEKKVYTFPAEEMKLPAKYHHTWPGIPRSVYVYHYEQEIIWGITAEIIHFLTELIKKHPEFSNNNHF